MANNEIFKKKRKIIEKIHSSRNVLKFQKY